MLTCLHTQAPPRGLPNAQDDCHGQPPAAPVAACTHSEEGGAPQLPQMQQEQPSPPEPLQPLPAAWALEPAAATTATPDASPLSLPALPPHVAPPAVAPAQPPPAAGAHLVHAGGLRDRTGVASPLGAVEPAPRRPPASAPTTSLDGPVPHSDAPSGHGHQPCLTDAPAPSAPPSSISCSATEPSHSPAGTTTAATASLRSTSASAIASANASGQQSPAHPAAQAHAAAATSALSSHPPSCDDPLPAPNDVLSSPEPGVPYPAAHVLPGPPASQRQAAPEEASAAPLLAHRNGAPWGAPAASPHNPLRAPCEAEGGVRSAGATASTSTPQHANASASDSEGDGQRQQPAACSGLGGPAHVRDEGQAVGGAGFPGGTAERRQQRGSLQPPPRASAGDVGGAEERREWCSVLRPLGAGSTGGLGCAEQQQQQPWQVTLRPAEASTDSQLWPCDSRAVVSLVPASPPPADACGGGPHHATSPQAALKASHSPPPGKGMRAHTLPECLVVQLQSAPQQASPIAAATAGEAPSPRSLASLAAGAHGAAQGPASTSAPVPPPGAADGAAATGSFTTCSLLSPAPLPPPAAADSGATAGGLTAPTLAPAAVDPPRSTLRSYLLPEALTVQLSADTTTPSPSLPSASAPRRASPSPDGGAAAAQAPAPAAAASLPASPTAREAATAWAARHAAPGADGRRRPSLSGCATPLRQPRTAGGATWGGAGADGGGGSILAQGPALARRAQAAGQGEPSAFDGALRALRPVHTAPAPATAHASPGSSDGAGGSSSDGDAGAVDSAQDSGRSDAVPGGADAAARATTTAKPLAARRAGAAPRLRSAPGGPAAAAAAPRKRHGAAAAAVVAAPGDDSESQRTGGEALPPLPPDAVDRLLAHLGGERAWAALAEPLLQSTADAGAASQASSPPSSAASAAGAAARPCWECDGAPVVVRLPAGAEEGAGGSGAATTAVTTCHVVAWDGGVSRHSRLLAGAAGAEQHQVVSLGPHSSTCQTGRAQQQPPATPRALGGSSPVTAAAAQRGGSIAAAAGASASAPDLHLLRLLVRRPCCFCPCRHVTTCVAQRRTWWLTSTLVRAPSCRLAGGERGGGD